MRANGGLNVGEEEEESDSKFFDDEPPVGATVPGRPTGGQKRKEHESFPDSLTMSPRRLAGRANGGLSVVEEEEESSIPDSSTMSPPLARPSPVALRGDKRGKRVNLNG